MKERSPRCGWSYRCWGGWWNIMVCVHISPLQNQTKAKTKTQNKLTRSFEFSLVSLCLRPQTKCGIYSGKMVDLRIREEKERKGVSGWNWSKWDWKWVVGHMWIEERGTHALRTLNNSLRHESFFYCVFTHFSHASLFAFLALFKAWPYTWEESCTSVGVVSGLFLSKMDTQRLSLHVWKRSNKSGSSFTSNFFPLN